MVWYTQISTAEDKDHVPFYENSTTKPFLESARDELFFICGLKGVGKTLLLRNKSARTRKSQDGIQFIPRVELTETLTTSLKSWNENEISRLSDAPKWQEVWRVVLAVVLAKRFGLSIPTSIAPLFPGLEQSESVRAHLDALLSARDLSQLLSGRLSAASAMTSAVLEKISSGVHLFVDAIDELVLHHAGDTLRAHDQSRNYQLGRLSAEVWTSAQIGFAKAAMEINRNHRHIRVYGAFRYEALERCSSSDRQNLEQHVLHIQYSHNDLRNIFLKKLETLYAANTDVFASHTGSLTKRFFGFSRIEHPTVRNRNRSPYKEDVLDYLIRHTRGRPRELDELGKGIQAIEVAERTQNSVRERVRIRSGDFFLWAISECIPYWRDEYGDFLRRLNSNWFSRDEIQGECSKYSESGINPCEELFNNGLIGCTVQMSAGSNDLQLRFRQFDPLAPVTLSNFTSAEYFAVHPSVNLATFQDRDGYQPDPWNVSGHGQKYVRARKKGHAHIGAGALGLGFVVPLLTSDTGLGVCVLQRLGNSKWDKLASRPNGEAFSLALHFVNSMGGLNVEPRPSIFTLIRDDCDSVILAKALEDWSRGERNLFVLMPPEGGEISARVLGGSSSVSTAVGGQNLASIASMISSHCTKGTRVYPFENDEKEVRKLADHLTRDSIEVVPVCVDRICQSPSVVNDGLEVEVKVETFSECIFLDRTNLSKQLFDPVSSRHTGSVKVVKNPIEFEFLRRRKRFLVNGVHFFFGLASQRHLDRVSPRDPEGRESIARTRMSHILVSTQEIQNQLSLVNGLFQLRLIVEAEQLGLISEAKGLQSLENSIEKQQALVLDRLQTVPDSVKRILNPSDQNLVAKARSFLSVFLELPQLVRDSKLIFDRVGGSEGCKRIRRDVQEAQEVFLHVLVGKSSS
ncbi:MAG: hypothetical protein ABL996_10555 [Micropepsaceae bacterium]